MARVKSLKGKAPVLTAYSWSLNDPGMGEYERAGLAGLYLSLTAADVWARAMLDSPVKRQAAELKEIASWEFPDKISLRLDWSRAESTADVFNAIVRWAWQVQDGVLFLPAVHRKQAHLDNYYLRLPTHNGIMRTFLQHNKAITRGLTPDEEQGIERAQNEESCKLKRELKDEEKKKIKKRLKKSFPKARDWQTRLEYYDEDQSFTVKFPTIDCHAELAHWKMCGKEILKRDNFLPGDSMERPSWLYPGSAPRFGKTEGNWSGPTRICFLLAFMPMACHFIRLPSNWVRDARSNRQKPKPNWAFIIPQVRSLSGFHKGALRRTTTPANWPFQSEVAGLQDAVLQYMAAVNLAGSGDVEVMATVMGEVAHYQNQKVRKSHLRFSLAGAREAVRKYRRFNWAFPASRIVKIKNETADNGDVATAFIMLPSCRERVAANLLERREWCCELTFVPFWHGDKTREEAKKKKGMSPERLWFNKLRQYEGNGLMTLTKKENSRVWNDEQDRLLVVDLFHRALRRLLNEEEFASKKRGGPRATNERWDDKVDKIRRQLTGAKTQPLCRAAIIDLLGEANSRRRKWTATGEERVGGPLFWQQGDEGDGLSDKLWQMLNDQRDYAKARDLALLALITFQDGRLGQPN